MKHLLSLALLVVFSAACPAVTVVQSALGGNASGSFTTGGTLTTTNGNFASDSTLGNTLLLVLWERQESSNADCAIVINNAVVTTSGFTWSTTSTHSSFQDNATATHCGNGKIFYIQNASVMTAATTTSVSLAVPNGEHCTCSIEFSLFELTPTGTITLGFLLSNNTGTGSNPNCGTLSPFGLCVIVGVPGSNLTAGSGYTLGPNATVATIGQGSYGAGATPYSGNLGLWAAIGLTATSPAAANVTRHRGSVF